LNVEIEALLGAGPDRREHERGREHGAACGQDGRMLVYRRGTGSWGIRGIEAVRSARAETHAGQRMEV
jgi:hypothetical protein